MNLFAKMNLTSTESFIRRHENQFAGMGLPPTLYKSAAQKILSQTLDAGARFHFQEVLVEDSSGSEHSDRSNGDDTNADTDAEEENCKQFSKYQLAATVPLSVNEDVFIIDHMWLVHMYRIL